MLQHCLQYSKAVLQLLISKSPEACYSLMVLIFVGESFACLRFRLCKRRPSLIAETRQGPRTRGLYRRSMKIAQLLTILVKSFENVNVVDRRRYIVPCFAPFHRVGTHPYIRTYRRRWWWKSTEFSFVLIDCIRRVSRPILCRRRRKITTEPGLESSLVKPVRMSTL